MSRTRKLPPERRTKHVVVEGKGKAVKPYRRGVSIEELWMEVEASEHDDSTGTFETDFDRTMRYYRSRWEGTFEADADWNRIVETFGEYAANPFAVLMGGA